MSVTPRSGSDIETSLIRHNFRVALLLGSGLGSGVSFAQSRRFAARGPRDRAELQRRIAVGLNEMRMTNNYNAINRRSYIDMAKTVRQNRISKFLLEIRCLQRRAALVVQSSAFKAMMAAFIVLNAILIGVSSDSDVRCAFLRDDACMPETSRVFALCNPVFTIIFTSELLLRIDAFGLEFYCSTGCALNLVGTWRSPCSR